MPLPDWSWTRGSPETRLPQPWPHSTRRRGCPTQRDSQGGGIAPQHFHSTQAEHNHGGMKGKCSNSSAFSPLTREELLHENEGHSILTPNGKVLLLFPKQRTGDRRCCQLACFQQRRQLSSRSRAETQQLILLSAPGSRQHQNLILSTLSWVSTTAKKAESLCSSVPPSHVAPQSATRHQPDSQHMHSDKLNTAASFTTYHYSIHDPTQI